MIWVLVWMGVLTGTSSLPTTPIAGVEATYKTEQECYTAANYHNGKDPYTYVCRRASLPQ